MLMFVSKLHPNRKNCTFFIFFAPKLHPKYLPINLIIIYLTTLINQCKILFI